MLYPSLVVEAGTAEATFGFEDPEVPRSFDGRGVTYGGALETVAIFGGDRWLLGAGYRFRTLRDVDLERSPAVEDAEVEADLGFDEHFATLRLGRLLAGGRVTPYLGVRARRSELDVDDQVRKEIFGGEVTQEERTEWRFESDSIVAVAGVDARLGGALVGRAEVGLGDDDTVGLLKLLYLPGARDGGKGPPWTPEEPAAEIAAEVRRLESELARAAEEIEPLRSTEPPVYLDRALDIVARIQAETVAVLERTGYSALADWFRDRATEARAELSSSVPGRQARRGAAVPGIALASFRGPAAAQAGEPADDGWLTRLARAVRVVIVRAEQRCLDIELSFTLEGARRASMWIHLRGAPATSGVQIRAGREPQRLRIGSYAYEVTVPGRQPDTYPCVAEGGGPLRQCPLDLASQPVRVVHCDFTDTGYEECLYAEPYSHCAGPPP